MELCVDFQIKLLTIALNFFYVSCDSLACCSVLHLVFVSDHYYVPPSNDFDSEILTLKQLEVFFSNL